MADAEVEHAAGAQDAVDVGDDGLGVDDVLVDVVEHDDVDRVVVEGQVLAAGEPEVDPLAEARPGLLEPRLVDVDPARRGTRRAPARRR